MNDECLIYIRCSPKSFVVVNWLFTFSPFDEHVAYPYNGGNGAYLMNGNNSAGMEVGGSFFLVPFICVQLVATAY